MKSELVPNLLFANCYLFQVHLLICFSCEWAALGRACFRAQVRMIMVHTTTTTTTSLPGRVEKFTWQKHLKIQMHSLQNTLGRYCQKPMSLSNQTIFLCISIFCLCCNCIWSADPLSFAAGRCANALQPGGECRLGRRRLIGWLINAGTPHHPSPPPPPPPPPPMPPITIQHINTPNMYLLHNHAWTCGAL